MSCSVRISTVNYPLQKRIVDRTTLLMGNSVQYIWRISPRRKRFRRRDERRNEIYGTGKDAEIRVRVVFQNETYY